MSNLLPSPNLDDLPINGIKSPTKNSQFVNSSPFQNTLSSQPSGFKSPLFSGGVVGVNKNYNYQSNNNLSGESGQFQPFVQRNGRGNYRQNRGRYRPSKIKFVGHCDGCGKSFKTEEQKDEHFSQHVKCQEAGCDFEAHGKIVEIHWYNIHGPLAKKLNLNINEDDEEWRRQRRKKFPTKARIEEKSQIKKERETKGAILSNNDYNHKRKRGRYNNKPNNGTTMQVKKNKDEQRISNSSDRKVYEESSNPMDLLAGDGESGEVESKSKEVKSSIAVVKNYSSSGLMSLMTAYSDSDSDEEEVTAEKDEPPKDEPPKDEPFKPAPSASRGSTKKGNTSTKRQSSSFKIDVPRKRFRTAPTRREHKLSLRAESRKPFITKQSLMQRLLSSEITDEHNTILQCVRFIVNNNFFDNN